MISVLVDLMIGMKFTKNFQLKIFFGYGSQADRFLINQNASNGLIYAISSSGIFGTIFLFFFH